MVSHESTSTLPAETRMTVLREVISQLGYQKRRASLFFSPDDSLAYHWFQAKDFRSYAGVYLHIVRDDDGRFSVYTRTNSGRSYYDCQHQNLTIKTLRQRFGGTFVTDFGVGRYFPLDFDPELPDQAGAHIAFQRFGLGLILADSYLLTRTFPGAAGQELYQWTPGLDPRLLSCHLLLPYLVSIFEDYIRSTFVALLRYSPSKEAALKGARLSAKQLAEISRGIISVEEAFAQSLSFQNVLLASENLKLVDRRIDLAGQLRKPYRKRKTSLFESLQRMVSLRHVFIHESVLDVDLDEELIWNFVDDLEVAVVRFYRHLTSLRGWHFDQAWGRPKRETRSAYASKAKVGLPPPDPSRAAPQPK
jgi:hypothetical protein